MSSPETAFAVSLTAGTFPATRIARASRNEESCKSRPPLFLSGIEYACPREFLGTSEKVRIRVSAQILYRGGSFTLEPALGSLVRHSPADEGPSDTTEDT